MLRKRSKIPASNYDICVGRCRKPADSAAVLWLDSAGSNHAGCSAPVLQPLLPDRSAQRDVWLIIETGGFVSAR